MKKAAASGSPFMLLIKWTSLLTGIPLYAACSAGLRVICGIVVVGSAA
jgi:hypothetical protein